MQPLDMTTDTVDTWITNTLFDDGFIQRKARELANKPLP